MGDYLSNLIARNLDSPGTPPAVRPWLASRFEPIQAIGPALEHPSATAWHSDTLALEVESDHHEAGQQEHQVLQPQPSTWSDLKSQVLPPPPVLSHQLLASVTEVTQKRLDHPPGRTASQRPVRPESATNQRDISIDTGSEAEIEPNERHSAENKAAPSITQPQQSTIFSPESTPRQQAESAPQREPSRQVVSKSVTLSVHNEIVALPKTDSQTGTIQGTPQLVRPHVRLPIAEPGPGRADSQQPLAVSYSLPPRESTSTQYGQPSSTPPAQQGQEPTAQSAPTIKISIGRIDVRAIMPPKPAAVPTPTRARTPMLSLDDYLKAQNGERR